MSGLNKYQKFIIESIFKNSVKNKTFSSSNLSWYEEIADTYPHIGLIGLWVDAEYIPEEAPSLKVGEYYTQKFNNVVINVLQKSQVQLDYVQGSNATFQSDELKDAIDPMFGEGYLFDLRDNSNSKIPLGLNKWIVDTDAGTLSFLKGFPSGYEQPLSVTFYKYVGRKGSTSLITTTGQNEMIEGYTPISDNQIVTKKYVDSNTSELSDLLEKLKPHEPITFKNTDLEILSPHRKAKLSIATDDFVDVVYDDIPLVLKPVNFYNTGIGKVSLLINNFVLYTKEMSDLAEDYSDNIFKLNGIVDPYGDDLMADEIYTCIDINIVLDMATQILPYVPQLLVSPYVDIKLKYEDRQNTYESNVLRIGIDTYLKIGKIYGVGLNNYKLSHSYISGVPALVTNDRMTFNCNYVFMNRFRKNNFGEINIFELGQNNLQTKHIYSEYSAEHQYSTDIIIPPNYYREQVTTVTNIYNLDDELISSKKWIWPFRIDSVSNENIRVISPNEDWSKYGEEWTVEKSKQSLIQSDELQLLNGKFQWPRGNYINNGLTSDFNVYANIESGPDYDRYIKPIGVRYVTFKRKIKDLINGFYFNFTDVEGVTFNTDTKIYNIAVLKCKIDNTDEEEYSTNKWLDMLSPYNGVLDPEETNTLACHVVNKSNGIKNYYTFGKRIKKGTLYITIGINYNLDIKFSNINIEPNI